MRDYGLIQCSLWTHPRFKGMSEFSQLLFLYLLSGRHSNGLGCYSLPLGYVSADLKKGFERVSKGFAELYQNGWAYHCESTEFVLIAKFLKWNPVANPKIAIARQKEFADVPSSFTYRPDLARALLKYGGHFKPEFETLLHTVSDTVSDTVSQTLSKQEQDRNKIGTREEQDNNPENSGESSGGDSEKKYTDDHLRIAETMAAPIREKFPTQKIKIEAWADDIRKLIDIDKRTEPQIIQLWNYILTHEGGNGFRWGDNCRTPGKLRQCKDGLPYFDLINQQRLKDSGGVSGALNNFDDVDYNYGVNADGTF